MKPHEPERGIVSQHVQGVSARTLEAHEKQKIELVRKYGPPVKLAAPMRGLADSVEAASLKFSGRLSTAMLSRGTTPP
jgi:hypothetical protein